MRPGIEYAVIGKEGREAGKTPHLQAFVKFTNVKHMAQVKQIFGTRCHLGMMYSTPMQAAEYCKKEGEYVEYGKKPQKQGQRNDIKEALKMQTVGEVMEKFPETYIKFPAGFKDIFAYRQADALEKKTLTNYKKKVFWLWGPTGTGKTRAALEVAPAGDVCMLMNDG